MGYIFMIMGMSGVGKTTLFKNILKSNKDFYELLQYTTRPPRPSEIDGKDYKFINNVEFNIMKNNLKFIESREYSTYAHKYSYGICKDDIKSGRTYITQGIDVAAYPNLCESLNHADIEVVPILLYGDDSVILHHMLSNRCITREQYKDACIRYLQDIDRYDVNYATKQYNIPKENCIDAVYSTPEKVLQNALDIINRSIKE